MMTLPPQFAGRSDYQQQLQDMRTQITPLRKELNLERKMEKSGDTLQKLDNKEAELSAKLKKSPKNPFLRAKRRGVILTGQALALKSLGQALLVYGGEMDGKESLRKQAEGGQALEDYNKKTAEHQAHTQALSETVTALRAETDPQKTDWLKEFEKTNGGLNKVETFVLNDWDVK